MERDGRDVRPDHSSGGEAKVNRAHGASSCRVFRPSTLVTARSLSPYARSVPSPLRGYMMSEVGVKKEPRSVGTEPTDYMMNGGPKVGCCQSIWCHSSLYLRPSSSLLVPFPFSSPYVERSEWNE